MKPFRIIRRLAGIALWVLMALLLVPSAAVVLLYSPWAADLACRYVTAVTADGQLRVRIGRLSVRPPLQVEADDFALVIPGSQDISARRLKADVELLPLLEGRIRLRCATLGDASLVMGAPDSATYMTIEGRSLRLCRASMTLSPMDIDIDCGRLSDGRVSLVINPDTTPADTATTPTPLKVRVGRLHFTNISYVMKMQPTVDSLGTTIGRGSVSGFRLDLVKQTIDVKSVTGSGLGVAYVAPATTAPATVAAADTVASMPWTVRIDTVGFDRGRMLYTVRGTVPAAGLDFGYISLDSARVGVRDFYNQASTVSGRLAVSGRERCGVKLQARGLLAIDSAAIALNDFTVETPSGTDVAFDYMMGMGDLTGDPSTPLAFRARGAVAPPDLALMFPFAEAWLRPLPAGVPISVNAAAAGTSGSLSVTRFDMAVARVARLAATGRIVNAFNPATVGGDLRFDAMLSDVSSFKDMMLAPPTASMMRVPPTALRGQASLHGSMMEADVTVSAEGGSADIAGRYDSRAQTYEGHLDSHAFPVNAFMPGSGMGSVTARAKVAGSGFDFMSPKAELQADADIVSLGWKGSVLGPVTMQANLAEGVADVGMQAKGDDLSFDLSARGNLTGEAYSWQGALRQAHADLQHLGLTPLSTIIDADLSADVAINPKNRTIAAKAVIDQAVYADTAGAFTIDNVMMRLNGSPDMTTASIHNRDFYAFLSSDAALDSIMSRMEAVGVVAADLWRSRTIDVDRMQRALPPFVLDINAGGDNALTDILAKYKMGFRSLNATVLNDSSLSLDAEMLGFKTTSFTLDTTTLEIAQYGPRLIYRGRVNNAPGTFDEWAHVDLDGYLADNRMGFMMSQRNLAGAEGYRVGLGVLLGDSTVTVSVDPADPTIAFQQWTVNEDNFVKWNFNRNHLDANLRMHGGASSLALYTDHDSTGGHLEQEDLVAQLTDIELADWVKLNPFAPPVTGALSADLRVSTDQGAVFGNGTATLANLMYDRRRVGTIGADLQLMTMAGGLVRAKADISVDSVRAITLRGALNDSAAASPLDLDLSVIRFPLKTVNPFLPRSTASVSGVLNGSMAVTGTGARPRLNGWLRLDTAAVRVDMLAASFPLSDREIAVTDNVVALNDFSINGLNSQPLVVNGRVNLDNLINPEVNLRLGASNFQICNSQTAARGAQVYGKGFANLSATVAGNMDFMRVMANLAVLPTTNLVYRMTDAAAALQSRAADSGLVKFVNFSDTSQIAEADSITSTGMAMLVQAALTLDQGATLGVDLSSDGHNRARIMPEGTLNFTLMPFSEPRLTGILTINSGYVRYTPPLLSEKNFTFSGGSTVGFTGDIMNPSLNIHAVDVLRANVTQPGQNSRLINFDVSLDVTGTLDNMNVVFDLATDDDATVANELQAMSAEQRANQAMNMLLYNVYSGPGTTANSNLSGNVLYSMLTSQLNSWAARTIKGVDLSFGVDQYDRTLAGATSTTTSYSYQVSKSLFDDRFKIVVGGNYSTDADADENFSQNLIKDISFEYFLNDARSMYLKLFRHTGFESILEGEITRTGVGFVYRRKMTTLGDLFRRQRQTFITIPNADEKK